MAGKLALHPGRVTLTAAEEAWLELSEQADATA
jgi:hypothetical protein